MKRLLTGLCAWGALVFSGCLGNEESAGVETTNGVTVAVLQPDGTPAPSATVKVIDSKNWVSKLSQEQSVALENFSLSADGEFFLPDSFFTGSINLQVEGESLGLFVANYQAPQGAIDTLVLQPLGSLEGNLTAQSTLPDRVYMGGSLFESQVESSTGAFQFPRIPAGSYGLVAQQLLSGSLQHKLVTNIAVKEGAQTLDTEFPVAFDVIPIDDMEDEILDITILGNLTGGNWFPYSDDDLDGASTSDFTRVFDDVKQSYVYQVTFALQPRDPYAYGGLGVNLTRKSVNDLTGLESIAFSARGADTLHVSLLPQGSQTGDNRPHLQADILLTDTWQSYTLALADFTPKNGTLAEALVDVGRIQFQMSKTLFSEETLQWWIDDLSLKGLTLDEFFAGSN